MRRTAVALSAVLALLLIVAVAQAATVYFQGAVGGRQVRPAEVALSADGTLEVTGVHWSAWGGPVAVGHGEAEYHGCNPNCASARAHHAAVTVRLSRARVCAGRHYYSHVSLTLRSGRLLDAGFLRTSWKPCR